jgi:ferredoxin, 2Fe-2S
MIKLKFIHPDGSRTSAEAKPGQSLMQAAVGLSIDAIAADCGGLLTCATCHVIVDDAWCGPDSPLPAASHEEKAMLEFTAEPPERQSRLSCQIHLTPELDGLTVRLPSRQY